MAETPAFERIEDHEFQPKEQVYVIDENGFDIYEAVIKSIEGLHYSVHYPEYPSDDQVLDGTARLLPKTRVNTRIYKNQEATRAQIAGEDEEADSDAPIEDDDDDNEQDFKPTAPPEKKNKKKAKKPKKLPKKKEPKIIPRPQGARSNPPRSTHKVYADYDTESE